MKAFQEMTEISSNTQEILGNWTKKYTDINRLNMFKFFELSFSCKHVMQLLTQAFHELDDDYSTLCFSSRSCWCALKAGKGMLHTHKET